MNATDWAMIAAIASVVAALAGVYLVGVTIRGFFAERTRVARRKRIANRLAYGTQQGQGIVTRCHETARAKEDPPSAEAEKWAGELFDYLQTELGNDYAVRFDNPSGLPIGFTTLMIPHSSVEGYVKARLARLVEILADLPS